MLNNNNILILFSFGAITVTLVIFSFQMLYCCSPQKYIEKVIQGIGNKDGMAKIVITMGPLKFL